MQSLRRTCTLGQSLRRLSSWAFSDTGIAQARTPPAEWYISDKFASLDSEHLFPSGWRLADVHRLPKASYRAGHIHGAEYLLTSDEDGKLSAFHNVSCCAQLVHPALLRGLGHQNRVPRWSVAGLKYDTARLLMVPDGGSSLNYEPLPQVCRHHAAVVVQGSGPADAKCQFECPYHGTAAAALQTGPKIPSSCIDQCLKFDVSFGDAPQGCICNASRGPRHRPFSRSVRSAATERRICQRHLAQQL
jgi:Rieske [2Fe-2S] domain